MSEWISRQAAADRLGVKQSRVYSLIRCGLLEGRRGGNDGKWYVSESDLEDYIQNRRQPKGRPLKELKAEK